MSTPNGTQRSHKQWAGSFADLAKYVPFPSIAANAEGGSVGENLLSLSLYLTNAIAAVAGLLLP